MKLDFSHWHDSFQSPTWYKTLVPEWKKVEEEATKLSREGRHSLKERVYAFVESELVSGNIVLGASGPNQDKERKPIDTAIIHHTSQESGISWQRLSAMHLMRLYGPRYFQPNEAVDVHRTGDPVYSHHFRDDGTQVFYGYHWLIRTDGSRERLLNDLAIGWQAGNWGVNCRSIGICLDGDFGHSSPPSSMIDSVKELLSEQYPTISKDRIFGHREINPTTECPGSEYLNGWRTRLVA